MTLERVRQPIPEGTQPAAAAVLMLGGLMSLMLLALLVSSASRGYDFTDEGFYLLWLSNPSGFDASVTQFGFIYHGLYLALDGDVATLRRVNVLLTWGLSFGLFLAIGYRFGETRRAWGALLALAWAGAGLALFRTGLTTPSYNSLALQGLLVAAIALVMLDAPSRYAMRIAPCLLGLGGALVFAAKPTSAAVLAPLTLLYMGGLRPLPVKQALVALVTAALLLCLMAFGIDGSLPAHLERLRGGVALGKAMDAGHAVNDLLRIPAFEMPTSMKLGTLALFTVSAVVSSGIPRASRWAAWSVAGGLAAAAMGVAFWSGWLPVVWAAHPLAPFLLLAVVAGMAFGVSWRADSPAGLAEMRLAAWRRLTLAGVLALLPVAFAFGTASNLWRVAGGAGVFWAAAAWVFVGDRPARREVLAGVALPIGMLMVTALLCAAQQRPYRQPGPLAQATQLVEIGPGGRSRLQVHPAFARSLVAANEVAIANGLKARDMVIDLTGQSPGLVYALGAGSPGAAWLLGGYRGSENLALSALGRASCETLASAWVISEPWGPRSLPVSVLERLGLPPTHWEAVGQWPAPALPTDRVPRPPQELLKPKVPAESVIASCKEHRAREVAP